MNNLHRIVLDGKEMVTREAAHDYLRVQLNFPDYYGCNLDALWDMLTGMDRETEICLVNRRVMEDRLGNYGRKLLQVLREAVQENSLLTVVEE